jgi:hypothetical protein
MTGDRTYRFVNRLLNRYERRTGRTFSPGHIGYGFYRWLLVDQHKREGTT